MMNEDKNIGIFTGLTATAIGLIIFSLIGTVACNHGPKGAAEPDTVVKMQLTDAEVSMIAALPLKCIQQEYPNKLNQTLAGQEEIGEPRSLHPVFYGCFDWHSALHGHWTLIRLMKNHPGLLPEDSIMAILDEHFTLDNFQAELAYFKRATEKSFERTYGWAWLLRLQSELITWKHPKAEWYREALSPLAEHITAQYHSFLPNLVYPIRVGEHTNTAFGLSLAHDYAVAARDTQLLQLIEKSADRFYRTDQNCPLNWEPSGFDFLSPCLEEANLMAKVLDTVEFVDWLNQFLPALSDSKFTLKPAEVKDRSDGKLVHLDGLNYSRAWCLYRIGEKAGMPHLTTLANEHIRFSLPQLADGQYSGDHWLGSFITLAVE